MYGTTLAITNNHDDASGSFIIVSLKDPVPSLAAVIFDIDSSDWGIYSIKYSLSLYSSNLPVNLYVSVLTFGVIVNSVILPPFKSCKNSS